MNYYIVGDIKPFTEVDFQKIEKEGGIKIPKDYKIFLSTYGVGDFSELLRIISPDKDHFKSTFQDYLDLWELTETEKTTVLNGITIAKTVDGDIILLVANSESPYVIMPRNDEKIIYFQRFEELIAYYKECYELDNDCFYFDSHYNYELEFFTDFAKDEAINATLFDSIYNQFRKQISFDKHINDVQPTYIIQNIGGWIYFDTVHKGSIRIKYQSQYKSEADNLIKFIRDKMEVS